MPNRWPCLQTGVGIDKTDLSVYVRVMSEPLPVGGAKQKILQVASDLFYAHGVRAVGVDRLIAASGVAKASFYRHFPAKDDLVVAFLQRRDQLWRDWLEDAVVRLSPDPSGRPLAIFHALFERFSTGDFRGCAFINSIVELADRDHAAHHAADAHKRAVIALVDRLLQAAGHAGPDLARSFVMLMDGAIVTAVREGDPGAALRAKAIAALMLEDAAATAGSTPSGIHR